MIWCVLMLPFTTDADRRGPFEKAVLVKVNRRVVAVVVETKLRRIPVREEILDIDVADVHLLMARGKRVQVAVGVFFEKVKIGQIVVQFDWNASYRTAARLAGSQKRESRESRC